MKAYERFLKYVSFDTTSDARSNAVPTTEKQNELIRYLANELKSFGLSEVYTDKKGFVYATIAATKGKEKNPVIGFLAHVDTVDDAPGNCIKPKIIKNYDGKDIVLNEEKNIVMKILQYPKLIEYKGQDIIVTDGTTLLGADDKAGIAEIMTMAEIIKNSGEHGTIKIAFTTDEEVGRGMEHFDLNKFASQFAYTVDGGTIGEIEYENFNAADVKVKVHGINIHPGSAKNIMQNAILLAIEFNSMLPEEQKPAYTEKYEGFFHLHSFEGNEESTTIEYLIRDHDLKKFNHKKEIVEDITNYLNKKYGDNTFRLTIEDSYYNMKEKILPHIHLIENAKKAFKSQGIEPKIIPIRGGTDGAKLSFMGIPCPNLSTGGENAHGRFEYIPIQSMDKMVDVLLEIVKIYANDEI